MKSTRLVCKIGHAAALGLLLQGCVTNATREEEAHLAVETQWQALAKAPVCCADLGEIELLEFDGDRRILTLQPGRSRAFETGNSYFSGTQLSALKEQSTIAIKSHFSSSSLFEHPSAVRPSFLILDRNRNVIATHVDVPLCFTTGWSEDDTGYFGLLQLDQKQAWALILYTSESARGSILQFESQATMAGGGVIVEGRGVNQHPAAPVGKVEARPLDQNLRERLARACPRLFE